MLSRVANSIYWMARYVERAENLARFIDVTLNVILDQHQESGNDWEPLIHTTGDVDEFKKRYGHFTPANVFNFLTFDREYHNSLITSLSMARENARTVREAISSEAWEQLNEFYHLVRDAVKAKHTIDWQTNFFHQVRQQSNLFNGILDSTMSRGKGWHFANLGRLLERADKTSRILDVKYFTLLPKLQDVGTTLDDLQWSAVLRSVSGFEMYRKRYHAITVHRVVEFLILDNSFPRAIRFCIDGANESLHKIIESPTASYRNLAEQRLGRLKAQTTYADVDTIINGGLHEFVDNLQQEINKIDDAIYQTFFAMRQFEEVKPMQTQSQG